MEVQIRPIVDRDLPELRVLQALSIRSFYGQFHPPEQVEALLDRQISALAQAHPSLVVAVVDGELVGFAALSSWRADTIDAVYVHPAWMRRGIGQRLVAALERLAIQDRKGKLCVVADVHASGFYQALGFAVRMDYRYALGDAGTIACHKLQKSLPQNSAVAMRDWLSKLLLLLLFSFGYAAIQGQVSDWYEQSIGITGERD
ncbi:GNAT family N-acetyltransferase [filamentous cyanobacterium LEGE 11480]|uniref:GNAT family N-acetyltransferase n=1 Tax=Romeriopsis navalis LEGE 11480 TaxID=2777977 RepID=A0A928VP61_9CYAN|nr:GNAT family N-acetyltransferase [Romeriopsis navalis]MBE9032218.1 GNAT family N-acetyltransferase [Romeriopsis navalis LEGE 11480]